ncbi:MAG: hypothetical protein Q7S74_04670 [Nanoarchaeota archaeon]|nr:hypothetical protein [Nanoarchaeota archaeon]
MRKENLSKISISGIVSKIEPLGDDIGACIFHFELTSEQINVSNHKPLTGKVLVYSPIDVSLEGQEVEINTYFGDEITQSVVSDNYQGLRSFGLGVARDIQLAAEQKGYRFNY